MKLYYHKTDGGAEYLMDKFIVAPNGKKEGVFEGSNYIVRIDGNIEEDAELTIRDNPDEISDTWHIDDIKSLDETLTDDEAQDILQIVDREKDANVGINWDYIQMCISMYKNGEKKA